MSTLDKDFVAQVEKDHFRTNQDTGANLNALFIWNHVRKHLGMSELDIDDLPAFCTTHARYHRIQKDYGCERKP